MLRPPLFFYGFPQALHQTCLRHLMQRCREMIQTASPAAARFPLAVNELLQQGLELRDRYRKGSVSGHELAVATGRPEARLDRWLDRHFGCPANQRLAKHLCHEQPHVFTFLRCPGLEGTNAGSEQAVRGMVVARQTWGGNRTWKGAPPFSTTLTVPLPVWP